MNSIAASFALCLADYEQLLSIIAESSSPLHQQLELGALQDELGRFKVWAGYVDPVLWKEETGLSSRLTWFSNRFLETLPLIKQGGVLWIFD